MNDNKLKINEAGNIITQEDLQELIGKSAQTIYRWKRKGLPSMMGNLYYLPDVIQWMRENGRLG